MFIILETTRACRFQIYHNVAFDSLYIPTENDITTYFRSAANRIHVLIWGSYLGCDCLITVRSISKRFTEFDRVIQGLHLASVFVLVLSGNNSLRPNEMGSMMCEAVVEFVTRWSPKSLTCIKLCVFQPNMVRDVTDAVANKAATGGWLERAKGQLRSLLYVFYR